MGKRREVECPNCKKKWIRRDGLVSTGVYNLCPRGCEEQKKTKTTLKKD